MDVLAAVEAFAGPERELWGEGEVAGLGEGLTQGELGVGRVVTLVLRVPDGGADLDLPPRPVFFLRQEILDEAQLAVRFGLVAQAVLGVGARGLEGLHAPAAGVGAVAGPEVAMELEAFGQQVRVGGGLVGGGGRGVGLYGDAAGGLGQVPGLLGQALGFLRGLEGLAGLVRGGSGRGSRASAGDGARVRRRVGLVLQGLQPFLHGLHGLQVLLFQRLQLLFEPGDLLVFGVG